MKKIFTNILIFIFIYSIVILSCFFVLFYPLKYKNYISYYSRVYNLDRYIVAGLINSESSFNVLATSNKNARGLTQLLDSTALEISQAVGVDYDSDMLYDAKYSIWFGCYYLNYLFNYYNGNIVTMLCAYNAGLNNVDSWISNSSITNFDSSNINSIPIKQTKMFVKNVLDSSKIYSSIWIT